MDFKQANEYIKNLKKDGTAGPPGWKNRRHIATNNWRPPVPPKLSRDSNLKNEGSLALCEIITTAELPGIDGFNGIIQVDEVGIWYTVNKTEDIGDASDRQGLIPWGMIQTLILHKRA